ncbi:MAG: transcription termination/antitermination protein NusG [Microgenomates group bacterium]|jgi:transcriptional antiterminator NusG
MNTDDVKKDDNQIQDDTAQVVETPVEEAATEEVTEETPQAEEPSENPAESSDAKAMEDKEVTEEAASENQSIGVSEDQQADSADVVEVAETPAETADNADSADTADEADAAETPVVDVPGAHWYVVHTYSGHENRVAASLKQRIESEHLENKILDVLVPTQEKIEIRSGKKENVKEKIFPGYILVRMVLDDLSWLAVRTTQGVTSFVGMSNKPTAIPDREVKSIVSYMTQGAQPTYKTTFSENDTVKIIDGPFAEFIGKVESVDKERGKIKVLVSIFGRETPVELDFLQVAKL